MGALLRSYWLPLLYSHELAERDGAPRRIRLLGENLVAFRDSEGRVGLLDHHCPHRRASLYFGRNEEGGLRCAYHGWKFDVDGRCIDLPTEADDCPLKRKVRALAYPCREEGGIVWTYMGRAQGEALPPLPELGWASAQVRRKTTLKYLRRCNWLQAMEGDFDSAHLGFLHGRLQPADGSARPGDSLRPLVLKERRPLIEVEDTSAGVMYGAMRQGQGGDAYWRITQFHLPFYTSVPAYDGLNRLKIWVPLDDEHTMVWEANWSAERDLDEDERRGHAERVPESGFLPDGDDWLGQGRFAARAENDYLIDRFRQKTHNFSGMEDATTIQDAAMQESMGAIVDRSREHLGPADAAIIRMRRRLEQAARTLAEHGTPPPGCTDSGAYRDHGDQLLVEAGGDWRATYAALMALRSDARPVEECATPSASDAA